ncbi:MAG: ABC transporter permease [bacterium]
MAIKSQIELPLKVAFRVVLQGIRVRFGRSVVTVLGVALGIAFLMSILTGQVIKSGVVGEQEARNEARRMYNTFVAEAGLPRGVVLGILQLGPVNEAETRVLKEILAGGVEKARWCPSSADRLPALPGTPVQQCERDSLGEGATALLVVGQGAPGPIEVGGILGGARNRLVFAARKAHALSLSGGDKVVLLERELRPDEVTKAAADLRKAGFRNLWIVTIALFVTVIGIANSMLMSVTERFREIGTMKCLGALSTFVRQMFLVESSLIGLVGAVAGAVVGALFSIVAYALTYGFGMVIHSLDPARLALWFVVCVVAGVSLAVMAALYPSRFASRMLPAHALRSEV